MDVRIIKDRLKQKPLAFTGCIESLSIEAIT